MFHQPKLKIKCPKKLEAGLIKARSSLEVKRAWAQARRPGPDFIKLDRACSKVCKPIFTKNKMKLSSDMTILNVVNLHEVSFHS